MAVASREPTVAREFADKWEIPRHYGSYQDLLDDPDIDAIYNPLPNSLHLEWTVRAAQAGKHIICEKPLALSEAECREMAAAADANDVKLLEAFMYRFHPRTDRVVEMVRSGDIGDLRVIRSSFTFRLARLDNIRLAPDLGGGALIDVGCYCVNVSRTMAGTEPVAGHAVARWTDRGVDDEMTGTMQFPGGVLAHFDCSLTMERNKVYEVAGTDGHIRVPASFLPGKENAPIHHHRGRDGVASDVVTGADQYQLMVEHFADSVLNDRALKYPAEEAALNMRTIEALYRSARAGGAPMALDALP